MSQTEPLLKVATRGSKLALWQARQVLSLLPSVGLRGKIQVITTSGDQLKDAPLHDFGGKGLFAREIETALCDGKADIAVHSLKDMPVQVTRTELGFACVLPRGRAGDVLLCQPRHQDLLARGKLCQASDLQRWRGLVIATGSLRRRYLLEQAGAGVKVQELRGNVDTRLRYLQQGRFDALLLAQAALLRLQLEGLPYQVLDPTWYVPSCAQGTIAVQSRLDCQFNPALQRLNCEATWQAVKLERAVIKALGGSCALPFGCHVRREQDDYIVAAVALAPTGIQARASVRVASSMAASAIVAEVVRRLRDDGLDTVLRDLGLPRVLSSQI